LNNACWLWEISPVAVLKTALATFVLSGLMVAMAVLAKVVAGRPIEVSDEAVPVLTLAIWTIMFLGFASLHAVEDALVQRQPAARECHGRRGRLERRFTIVAIALCLTVVSLVQAYLGDELSPDRVLLDLALAAVLTMAVMLIVDLAVSRRKPRRSD
jgi:hypothetical protein